MLKGLLTLNLTRYLSLLLLLLLSACSDSGDTEKNLDANKTPDNTAKVKAYYVDNSQFFSFKNLSDIPDDLVWENGSELAEFGSPNAIKGGTHYKISRARFVMWVQIQTDHFGAGYWMTFLCQQHKRTPIIAISFTPASQPNGQCQANVKQPI